MAARIRSLRNGLTPVDEASRDDLVVGDVVTVQSLDSATTYTWTLMYAPEGSSATFSGDTTAISPGTFTVDKVGPYLIRLVVDAGEATEDTQYVRLRALTTGLGLTLVAAGERRDASGTIPVDVDVEGWANEQNANLLALEAASLRVDTLADTLASGNITGGTSIIVTTGDEIQAQSDLVLRADSSPGDSISLLPGASGTVALGGASTVSGDLTVSGKLTVSGLIDPTGLILTEAAAPTTNAGEGALFVSDGSGGLTAGELYYQAGGSTRKAARFRVPYHFSMPEVPNDTVEYRGWVHEACTLIAVRVYMAVVNTQGNYTLTVTNESTGNTVLATSPFDMNTLTADTVTDLNLTAVTTDLEFPATGRWTVSLTSDNAGFDGSGVYVELVFEV